MQITYSNSLDGLTADQLEGFFVGWRKHPDPKAHLEILERSYAVWLALDQDRCVGFVNALSDGVYYAYIPLLEVLPVYQRHGIGKELVNRMIETLGSMYAVDIVCDESVVPFYESIGLSRCVAMVKRNYENQGLKIG